MKGLLLAVVLIGCGHDEPAPAAPAVHEDVASLAKVVTLPASARSARWTSRSLGNPGSRAPGPTDEVVYAAIELAGEPALALGPGQPGTGRLPADVAAALLPPSVVSSGRRVGPDLELTGTTHDPTRLTRGAFRGTLALRVGSTLVIVAQTM